MKKQANTKTVPIQNGGKKSGGVTPQAMKDVGRNLARANYQSGKK